MAGVAQWDLIYCKYLIDLMFALNATCIARVINLQYSSMFPVESRNMAFTLDSP